MSGPARAVRYHDGERFVAALAREGRARLHLVFIDDAGVRHESVNRDAARGLRDLEYHGRPYPVARMVKKLRAVGRERGITKAAASELRRAVE